MPERLIVVNANVQAESEEQAARAMEVLSRAVLGLALEGAGVNVMASVVELDDDGEE